MAHSTQLGSYSFPCILIRGAGDLASGVAIRLHRCGFPVIMTEIERPLVVRRAVAFAQAVYDGATQVEEVRAVCTTPAKALDALGSGAIPVLVDPLAASRRLIEPYALVDAIMAKRNLGTQRDDASLVVALGPGFTAGIDCHAVIETNRGHDLGRVIWRGAAQPDTRTPGALPGLPPGLERALYAESDGCLAPYRQIGDSVHAGETIAEVVSPNNDAVAVIAPFDGVLRGLIHPSVFVTSGMKIGDVDPRIQPHNCFTVSDKSLAIGGAVVEAILTGLCGRSAFTDPS